MSPIVILLFLIAAFAALRWWILSSSIHHPSSLSIGQPETSIGQLEASISQPGAVIGQPEALIRQPFGSIGQKGASIGQPFRSLPSIFDAPATVPKSAPFSFMWSGGGSTLPRTRDSFDQPRARSLHSDVRGSSITPVATLIPDRNGLQLAIHLPDLQTERRTQQTQQTHPTNQTPMQPTQPTHIVDKENVHDSAIVHQVKHHLHALRDTYSAVPLEKHLKSLRKHIEQAGNQRWSATNVLDVMETNELPMMSNQMKESEILGLLWHHIENGPFDSQQQQQLKDNMVERLADARDEHGLVRCTTGRVTRAMDAFTGIDDRLQLRTIDQERQFLLPRVQTLIETHIASLSDDDQRLWANDDPRIKTQVIQFVTDKLRQDASVHPSLIAEVPQWIHSL